MPDLDPLGTSRRRALALFLLLCGALLLGLGAAGLASGQSNARRALTQAPDHYSIPETDEGLPGAGPIRRHDWFQNLWRTRRLAWSNSLEQDRHAVVFLGDSITQGWGHRLSEAFPHVKVANRGISGDTSRGVLLRLKEDVLALDPKAVVLLIGTNDVEDGAAPETVASNVELILEALEAHNAQMPIVLCEVFPSSPTKKRPPQEIKSINALFRTATRDDLQVTYVETWSLFADQNGNARAEEFPDLLHPNDAGYRKWSAALRPVFTQLGLGGERP